MYSLEQEYVYKGPAQGPGGLHHVFVTNAASFNLVSK